MSTSKRMLICMGALAFLTSTVMAGDALINIPPLGEQSWSSARCITPDGVYVGGNMGGLPVPDDEMGFVWDAVNGARQPMSFGDPYYTGECHEDGVPQREVTGIAYRNPGDLPQLVIHGEVPSRRCDRQGWPAWNRHAVCWSTDGGMTWTLHTRLSRGGNEWPVGNKGSWFPDCNSAAGSNSESVYATTYLPRAYDSQAPKLYVEQMYGGDPPSWSLGESRWRDMPRAKEKAIGGVSAAGLAVGWTRDSDHGEAKVNLLLQHETGERWMMESYFEALNGDLKGTPVDISDNGAVVVGSSPIDDVGNYPYMYDVASDVASELASLPGMDSNSANGVDADGTWAVGHCGSLFSTKAVAWDLSDPDTVIDLGQYYADRGLFDGWLFLYRAFAVAVNDNNEAVIVGEGFLTDGSMQAFVATMCHAPIVLAMDILPYDDPNLFTVNKKGQGRLPIEIYGTEDFSVEDIDLGSIMVAGAVSPVKAQNDLDYNGDGYLDLKIHVARRELIDALSLDTEIGNEVEITVEADTVYGCEVMASDTIICMPRD